MIKSLRRKFIVTAMLSLSILIFIIIGSVAVLGYYQMEQTADSMLEVITSERKPPEPGSRAPYPVFGYEINQVPIPAGYFSAYLTADGQILSVDYIRMMEITEEEAKQ